MWLLNFIILIRFKTSAILISLHLIFIVLVFVIIIIFLIVLIRSAIIIVRCSSFHQL